MFEKGTMVVSANHGICEITDVVTMNMSNIDKKYFLLIPISDKTAKVYIPVDSAAQRIRQVMTEAEAWELIKRIPDIEEIYVENEKEREKIYKEVLFSREPKRITGIIKTLYFRRKERADAGKKNIAVDERYFKLAENQLHGELAFALNIDREKVLQVIQEHMTK